MLLIKHVTILVLVETPLQSDKVNVLLMTIMVTILVLVETPLQSNEEVFRRVRITRHNPCFSGNSFAIELELLIHRYKTQSQSLF